MPIDQRERILTHIRLYGGASIFWLTKTQARARAVDALIKSGEIVRHKDDERDAYPWCVYSIAEVGDSQPIHKPA